LPPFLFCLDFFKRPKRFENTYPFNHNYYTNKLLTSQEKRQFKGNFSDKSDFLFPATKKLPGAGALSLSPGA
jgi:hypothetical protein